MITNRCLLALVPFRVKLLRVELFGPVQVKLVAKNTED